MNSLLRTQTDQEDLSALKISPGIANLRDTRATKIVATLGPASSSEESIRELVQAGANIFRLNFSHAKHDWAETTLQNIRKISSELGSPVGVIQDLQGPKVRISELPSGEIILEPGEKVLFRYGKYVGQDTAQKSVFTEAFDPREVLKNGERVFLADAKIELVVQDVMDAGVVAGVLRGGTLRSKAGIAVPDSVLSLPAASAKDIQDLAWGLEHGVNYVALSFVKDAADITLLRGEMERCGRLAPIIAKIERKEALENLEEIIQSADAVMVARGDLGVDIPIEKVPAAQRRIMELAHKHGKPVIVATQMLPSMVDSEIPTRAEVSDVFLAAELGADAVMLSEETSIGKNPAGCVRTMAKIVDEGEQYFNFDDHNPELSNSKLSEGSDAELVALSACAASRSGRFNAIIVCSESGNTARLVSKHRPQVPIFGMSTQPETLARMALYWGVNPIAVKLSSSSDEERERAFNVVAERYFLEHPEAQEFSAVVVNGPQPGNPNSASRFEVRRVERGSGRPL